MDRVVDRPRPRRVAEDDHALIGDRTRVGADRRRDHENVAPGEPGALRTLIRNVVAVMLSIQYQPGSFVGLLVGWILMSSARRSLPASQHGTTAGSRVLTAGGVKVPRRAPREKKFVDSAPCLLHEHPEMGMVPEKQKALAL